MVNRLGKLYEHGEIESEQLQLGRVEIEESANKLVLLYQLDPKASALKQIRERLKASGAPLVSKPALGGSSNKSKLVYAVDDSVTLRLKWVETHTAWRSQLPASPTMKPERVAKIVIFVLDKATGRVQLRFDKPERDNPHKEKGNAPKEAYFEHYREQVEDLCGVTLAEVELRPAMERIINARPWLVELGHNEQLTDDGYTLKYSSKIKGKDVRNGKHYAAGEKHSGSLTTHEVESMTWLPESSNGKIGRRVFTHVNGRVGSVRFDAYCHEAEVLYVLGHFKPSQKGS